MHLLQNSLVREYAWLLQELNQNCYEEHFKRFSQKKPDGKSFSVDIVRSICWTRLTRSSSHAKFLQKLVTSLLNGKDERCLRMKHNEKSSGAYMIASVYCSSNFVKKLGLNGACERKSTSCSRNTLLLATTQFLLTRLRILNPVSCVFCLWSVRHPILSLSPQMQISLSITRVLPG